MRGAFDVALDGVDALRSVAFHASQMTGAQPGAMHVEQFRRDCAKVLKAYRALRGYETPVGDRVVSACGVDGTSALEVARTLIHKTAGLIRNGGKMAGWKRFHRDMRRAEFVRFRNLDPDRLSKLKAEILIESRATATQPAAPETPAQPAGNSETLKRPPGKAWQAFYVREFLGIPDQEAIARKMVEQGVKASQPSVSRWLKAVDAFLAAGGEQPLPKDLHAQPETVDPAVLEMGERRDGRTPRQRAKRDPSDDRD